jgi:transposase
MAVAGIDSHKDTLAVAVVDEQGRELGRLEAENAPQGHQRMLVWLGVLGASRVGIEGSGSSGRAAALRLKQAGLAVVEVPPQLTAQARRRQRTPAKSDPIDALLIARITLRDEDLPQIRPDGALEDLRVLVHHRRELRSERNRMANRLHADLEQLRPGYQERIGRLTTARNLDRARRLLAGDNRVRARVARQRVARLRQLTGQLEETTDEIRRLAAAFDTGLATICGVAELAAAELLAEIGDISKYRTKAQFAMANGTAPLPASSGRTDRHRLNRGGNRQLNRVIHFVALTQVSRSPEGRRYYLQKQQEGKTSQETLRCLKRRVSDRIFKTLRASEPSVLLT